MPPYPPDAMRHLASPVGAGGLDAPHAIGEAGAEECGDTCLIEIAVVDGIVTEAGFRVRGCGATTAAASAACEALQGASLLDALRVSATSLDAALGGLGPERRHGVDVVADAVTNAIERWFADGGATAGGQTLQGVRPRHGSVTVAVAMSGGVDSAVAAMLLADAGYDVVGVTMRLWHDPSAARAERSCCAPDTVRMARETCAVLGVPHLVVDAAERFRAEVVEEFVAGYREGRTPNPCITCNGEVRFRILGEAARALGAQGMATGHYARVDRTGAAPVLARAADPSKDQTYMLARLGPDVIARLHLPLGDLTKDQVRALAAERGLPAAEAVESQDVCFVGVGGYQPFLERHAGMDPVPGDIVDTAGEVLGTHDGHWRYTVGQRKGIGVAAGDPLYVIATDAARNVVVVGTRDQLAAREIEVDHLIAHEVPDRTLEVRIRHHGQPLRGRIVHSGDGTGRVVLEDAAEAVAPGQTAALYDEGRLVAAGTIARAAARGNRTEA